MLDLSIIERMNRPIPTLDRIEEFKVFVKRHWDNETIADAFRDYDDYPPLHTRMMSVLAWELARRSILPDYWYES